MFRRTDRRPTRHEFGFGRVSQREVRRGKVANCLMEMTWQQGGRAQRGAEGNEGKRQNSRFDDTSEHAGFFWGKAKLRGYPLPNPGGSLEKRLAA